MATISTILFEGREYELSVYNGQAIINVPIRFFTVDCQSNEVAFDFDGFESAYFKVYSERIGRTLKTIIPTRSAEYLILNASESDMTFEDNGKYFYEIGYIMSGGYDIVLRYGQFNVL